MEAVENTKMILGSRLRKPSKLQNLNGLSPFGTKHLLESKKTTASTVQQLPKLNLNLNPNPVRAPLGVYGIHCPRTE